MDREIRIIVSTRVIDSEGPRWVLLNAVKSDWVVVLMESYSANDIVEPTFLSTARKGRGLTIRGS